MEKKKEKEGQHLRQPTHNYLCICKEKLVCWSQLEQQVLTKQIYEERRYTKKHFNFEITNQ